MLTIVFEHHYHISFVEQLRKDDSVRAKKLNVSLYREKRWLGLELEARLRVRMLANGLGLGLEA